MKCDVCGRKATRSADLRIGDRCNNPYEPNGCDGNFVAVSQVREAGTPPDIKILSSGYLRISFSQHCWAQFPKDFRGLSIPDDYIFQPDHNRARINKWWRANLPNIEELLHGA